MRLIRSELGLRAVLALRQSGPAHLAELARTLGVRTSSLQRAVEILADAGLVEAEGEGRARTHRLRADSDLLAPVEQLAELTIEPTEALTIVARANRAIELVAVREREVVVVFRKHGRAADQSRAARTIGRIAHRTSRSRRLLHHEDVRDELLIDPALREALGSARILYGDVDVSLPDRSQHGRRHGVLLGRVSPDLRLPPPRLLRTMKRRHGVRALRVFGSAVRSDFRPDSDVDVAVELAAGTARRGDVRAALEEELERHLQRDVDVVLADTLRPSVRRMVEREGVAL